MRILNCSFNNAVIRTCYFMLKLYLRLSRGVLTAGYKIYSFFWERGGGGKKQGSRQGSSIFWDVTLCSFVDWYYVYGGTYSIHLQGWPYLNEWTLYSKIFCDLIFRLKSRMLLPLSRVDPKRKYSLHVSAIFITCCILQCLVCTVGFSEMLVLIYQTSRRHIPEDRNLNTYLSLQEPQIWRLSTYYGFHIYTSFFSFFGVTVPIWASAYLHETLCFTSVF
jgi:hypothetical protein